jgi:hypothetical protein
MGRAGASSRLRKLASRGQFRTVTGSLSAITGLSHRAGATDLSPARSHRNPRRISQLKADPSRRIEERLFFARMPKNAVERGETGYNFPMQLAIFAMRALEVMFFAGLAGSTVVIILSFIEDGKELFGKDEPQD